MLDKTFYTSVRRLGNNLLYRGVERGRRVMKKVKYKPSLFVSSPHPTKWKTLDDRYVNKINFSTMGEAQNFIDEYRDVDNFPIYGNSSFEYVYIQDLFATGVDYHIDLLRIAFLDIEVDSSDGFPSPQRAQSPITAITLKLDGKFYVFALGSFETTRKDIVYTRCVNERELIYAFLNRWSIDYPDIVVGWGTDTFDIPYLVNRITNIFGEDYAARLSPWGKFAERSVNIMQREHLMFDIYGVANYDYIRLYQKFAPHPNQENYKLNTIANVELGKEKLSFDGSLTDLYRNDHQKFLEYNILDVELVAELDDKLELLSMAIDTVYDANVNFPDVFSQVRMWDTLIYAFLRRKNIVVPPKTSHTKDKKYAGAYVKPPTPGMHHWVVSYDVKSLYPSLIEQFNISPDCLLADQHRHVSIDKLLNRDYDLSDLAENNLILAANGHCFKNDRVGFLPEILSRMMIDRDTYKKKKLDAERRLEEVRREISKREGKL